MPPVCVQKLAGPIVGQSAEAGSRALVHAATSPDMKGRYFRQLFTAPEGKHTV
jgi:hypothetical protein